MPDLSFVSPVYGCRQALAELCNRINASAAAINKSCEIILVDDRCPQDSWTEIKRLAGQYDNVHGLRLSRNFGQHAAIEAGIRAAKGEWIVVIDCDLQDRPEFVGKLYEKALEGYDVVRARRMNRTDSFIRRWLSKSFYRFIEWMTETKQDPTIGNFGIYNRKVIDAIVGWREQVRFFPAIVQWVGFRHAVVDIEHAERFEGNSSYNLKKLLSLALTVALSFSDKPLRVTVMGGLAIATLAVFLSMLLLLKALFSNIPVEGWASLMLSIWFLGGCIISVTGIAGLYIGRALLEAKQRPVFIIDEVTTG